MVGEQRVIEGTWEEIAAQHGSELAGKIIRVTVLESAPQAEVATQAEIDAFLDAFTVDTKGLPPPSDTYSREVLYADHD